MAFKKQINHCLGLAPYRELKGKVNVICGSGAGVNIGAWAEQGMDRNNVMTSSADYLENRPSLTSSLYIGSSMDK